MQHHPDRTAPGPSSDCGGLRFNLPVDLQSVPAEVLALRATSLLTPAPPWKPGLHLCIQGIFWVGDSQILVDWIASTGEEARSVRLRLESDRAVSPGFWRDLPIPMPQVTVKQLLVFLNKHFASPQALIPCRNCGRSTWGAAHPHGLGKSRVCGLCSAPFAPIENLPARLPREGMEPPAGRYKFKPENLPARLRAFRKQALKERWRLSETYDDASGHRRMVLNRGGADGMTRYTLTLLVDPRGLLASATLLTKNQQAGLREEQSISAYSPAGALIAADMERTDASLAWHAEHPRSHTRRSSKNKSKRKKR